MKLSTVCLLVSVGMNLGVVTYMLKPQAVTVSPAAVKELTKPLFQEVNKTKVTVQAQLVYFRAKQLIESSKVEKAISGLYLKVENQANGKKANVANCEMQNDGSYSMIISVEPITAQDIDNRNSEFEIMKEVISCLDKTPTFI